MSENSGNKICVNCKPTEKEIPANDMNPCENTYEMVDKCMKQNKGQISSCVNEWNAFKICHEKYSSKR